MIRATLITLALILCTLPAWAQPSESAVAEARAHFERGLELFNEGRHDASLAEFSRAYEIAPAPPVLYNIARVHAALGNAVEATDTYERYLRESGEGLDARRRREVTRDLERQRARIATLMVTTNVEGATVSVDGIDVATTPLSEPLRLAAGEHTIGARGAGHDASRRSVRLAGGDRQVEHFDLVPFVSATGTLRIVSEVPDVEVFLDERSLGTTPLNATIPAPEGNHVLVARRAGYRDQRIDLVLQGGAERVVDLEMEPEAADSDAFGTATLRLPDAPSVLRIDGEPVIPDPSGIALPAGRHHVEVEVAEREPHEATIEIPAGETVELSFELIWTPDARAQRVAAARSTRTAGQVLTIAGGAVLLGGVGLLGWNESRISDTDADLIGVNAMYEAMMCGTTVSDACDDLDARGRSLTEDQEAESRARWISVAVTGVGVVLTVVGVILWAKAPSERDIDDEARASRSLRLLGTVGGLALDGTF